MSLINVPIFGKHELVGAAMCFKLLYKCKSCNKEISLEMSAGKLPFFDIAEQVSKAHIKAIIEESTASSTKSDIDKKL